MDELEGGMPPAGGAGFAAPVIGLGFAEFRRLMRRRAQPVERTASPFTPAEVRERRRQRRIREFAVEPAVARRRGRLGPIVVAPPPA